MGRKKIKKKGVRKNRRSREKIKAKKIDPSSPKSESKKELTISAIDDGTVIDHIPSDATFKVADILRLEKHDGVVSIATNLHSKSVGSKGIVKVGGKSLTQDEVNKIAIVAPDATVNIITNYNVKEKIKVKSPDFIDNVVKCSNPVCITNNEQVNTKFYVVKKDPLKIRCHYCERNMGKEDIQII
ncbi:aspartate carbamoyltransferase regulatory subunit [Candidatus Woesearchaeota archaeon]|jgi:aspartate carbamoyltransferase regulatory subunit|nr:aspartate carbamoyltransferase regulatory subunit [Candidatus Woesearchaeota archaeon]MDP6648426.1 aspartate carbamoyltransferase regulatory subunit [Candidatus Woesearchaeota archaeon]|tara:strand:- start:31881 stop:32435 length:555 start_codon:yes stop_codon:yes gene_type:complete